MTGCERRVRDPETGFKTQVPVPKSAGFEGAFLGSPVVVTRLFLVGRGGERALVLLLCWVEICLPSKF